MNREYLTMNANAIGIKCESQNDWLRLNNNNNIKYTIPGYNNTVINNDNRRNNVQNGIQLHATGLSSLNNINQIRYTPSMQTHISQYNTCIPNNHRQNGHTSARLFVTNNGSNNINRNQNGNSNNNVYLLSKLNAQPNGLTVDPRIICHNNSIPLNNTHITSNNDDRIILRNKNCINNTKNQTKTHLKISNINHPNNNNNFNFNSINSVNINNITPIISLNDVNNTRSINNFNHDIKIQSMNPNTALSIIENAFQPTNTLITNNNRYNNNLPKLQINKNTSLNNSNNNNDNIKISRTLTTNIKCQINDSNYDPQKNANKPWKCNIPGCNKRFKHDSNLRIHSIIHTPQALICPYCKKKFARNSNLKQHLRVHTGERPFVCDICGHAFKQQHSLKDHKRIHTGERPFACKYCNKTFTVKHNWTNHQKMHKQQQQTIMLQNTSINYNNNNNINMPHLSQSPRNNNIIQSTLIQPKQEETKLLSKQTTNNIKTENIS